MWTRRELKERGKSRFKATYWKTVLVSLIMMIFVGGTNFGSSFGFKFPIGGDSAGSETTNFVMNDFSRANAMDVAGVVAIALIGLLIFLIIFAVILALTAFLINPIEVGCSRYFVYNLEKDADVKEAFSGFDKNYKNTVKVMFFRCLYTSLWSLLFVIPGIIKSYEYRMIPYLLAENPDMEMDTAFSLSRQMMMGNKWEAFVLDLSFILWHILSIFTCGILEIFYVAPYVDMTNAALYETLKNHYQQGQTQQGQTEAERLEGSVQEM